MSEYDQRQLRLMTERVESFEKGQLELGLLVRDLQALLHCLESVPSAWKEAFHSEWWTLEQAFAVALDRQEDPLSPTYQPLVKEAVDNLKHLLKNVE